MDTHIAAHASISPHADGQTGLTPVPTDGHVAVPAATHVAPASIPPHAEDQAGLAPAPPDGHVPVPVATHVAIDAVAAAQVSPHDRSIAPSSDLHDDAASAQLPGEAEHLAHAGLPDEGDAGEPRIAGVETGAAEAGGRLSRSQPAKASRRRSLLLGGGIAAAIGVAVVGVAVVSPHNPVFPMPRLASSVRSAAASVGLTARPLLAPAASLANVTLPPAIPPPMRETYIPPPKDQAINELLALRAGHQPGDAAKTAAAPPALSQTPPGAQAASATPRAAGHAAAAAPPAGYVPLEPGARASQTAEAMEPPHSGPTKLPASANPMPDAPVATPSLATVAGARTEPGSAPPAGPPDMTAKVLAAVAASSGPASEPLAPIAPTPVLPAPPIRTASSVPPAMPSLGAADPVVAPITPAEQIKVMDLVTEMATMVKTLKKQDQALRSDLAKRAQATADRMDDLERRLGMYEAHRAVEAARDAGQEGSSTPQPITAAAPSSSSPVVPLGTQPVKLVPVALSSNAGTLPAAASATLTTPVKRWRVQAASPDLAWLAEVDRGGGEGAQLQVTVGDKLPDYGLVKSIAQKGTSWIVVTERGAIQ